MGLRLFRLGCILFVLLLCSLLNGCGSSGSSAESEVQQSGALRFDLQFAPAQKAQVSGWAIRTAAEPDVCADYLIDTIQGEVYRPDDTLIASEQWTCDTHGGTVAGVPVGSNYYFVCKGLVGADTRWQEQIEQIEVVADKTTQIGTIIMRYVGDDTHPPNVAFTIPAGDMDRVDLNTIVAAVFDEPLAVSSIADQAAVVSQAQTPVPGNVTYNAATYTLQFKPQENLTPLTTYTVSLNADLSDTAGIVFGQSYSWQFTTGDTTDTTAPQIIDVSPLADAENQLLSTIIRVTFDESMDPGSFNTNTCMLTSGQGTVPGKIVYDPQIRTLVFTPDTPLAASTVYTATISADITDVAGNPFATAYTWNFSTAQADCTVTLTKAGNGKGIVTSAPSGIDCGTQCSTVYARGVAIALSAAAETGSIFMGWSGQACSGADACEFVIQDDTWVTATFTVQTFNINAVANTGGSISPSGNVVVAYGDNQSFQIIANRGYYLADLIVDGMPVTPVNTYTFEQVIQGHTIQASFKALKYVDNSVAASGDGQSWSSPFQSIQEAIKQAGAGDEIWIKQGAYRLTAPLVVNKPLVIYGGFAGNETHPNQRELQTFKTTIDGNKSVGCIYITADALLDGFKIIDGRNNDGGGVYAISAATLQNCEISDCVADNGAGIFTRAQLSLSNCTLSGNRAQSGFGGGIYSLGEENNPIDLLISQCEFNDNISQYDGTDSVLGGGALYAQYNQALQITDSTFQTNTAQNGGAVYIENGGTVAFDQCRFQNNVARHVGAAIYNDNTTIHVSGSDFTGNNTRFGAGAFFTRAKQFDSLGISTIINSTFVDNAAGGDDGGALHMAQGKFNIINSLFYLNYSHGFSGGAIHSESLTTVRIINCTVAQNKSDASGGGVRLDGGGYLYNSILWANDASSSDENQISGPVYVYNCDIDQDGFAGQNGNIRQDPQFVNQAIGDFHLTAGSDCINKGDNNAPYLPEIDLEGNDRINDSIVDMGAYESLTTP